MTKVNITKKGDLYYLEFCSKANQFMTIKIVLEKTDMESLVAKINAIIS